MALYKEIVEIFLLKNIKSKAMKIQSNKLLSPLSEEKIINLTTEVKEILATSLSRTQNKILSTADLWNIQRQRKARALRRYI